MAKKTFGELKGIQLRRINKDGKPIDIVQYTTKNDEKIGVTYSVINNGDPLFLVDMGSLAIKSCIVKFVREGYYTSTYVTLGYCDKSLGASFIPNGDQVSGYSVKDGLGRICLPMKRSQYGLFATNLNDALEILDRIKNGNTFIQKKVGDSLYVVNRISNTVEKLVIRSIDFVKNTTNAVTNKMVIVFTDDTKITLGASKYSSKASLLIDTNFEIRMSGNYSDCFRYFLYTTEKEAVSGLNTMIKRYGAAKKKAKKEFENGTEIKIKDCRNNTLHIGDKVAYIRNSGQASLIGTGIIVKETKAQIQVFDEEDRECIRNSRRERNENCKQYSWYKERQVEEDNDGYHFVTKRRVILIENYKNKK